MGRLNSASRSVSWLAKHGVPADAALEWVEEWGWRRCDRYYDRSGGLRLRPRLVWASCLRQLATHLPQERLPRTLKYDPPISLFLSCTPATVATAMQKGGVWTHLHN